VHIARLPAPHRLGMLAGHRYGLMATKRIDNGAVQRCHLDIQHEGMIMVARNPKIQIDFFCYRTVESASDVTRKAVKRLAKHLGVDETQANHQTLNELAARVLPQYEKDDGPLSAAQVREIKKRVPQGTKRSVWSRPTIRRLRGRWSRS
jgi:hypothetical protein